MSRTLYVSDMDGTLLGTDSRVSARSAEIISRLTAAGALITVATARTPATVVPLMAQAHTMPPAIVMTGTALWDYGAAAFSDPHFISADDVRAALAFCLRHGVHPFVYVMAPDGTTMDVYHAATALGKAESNFYEARCRLKLKRFHLGTPVPQRAFSHTMLLYAIGEARAVMSAAEAFRSVSDCSVQCYPDIFNPEIYNLEIFPPGISKASAILKIKESSGAGRLVVFGDNLNDLSMFGIADVAVAVGNALPEVKSAAHVVIEPNYTDSVARFIASDYGM